jgi:hypothetical protein
VLCVGVESGQSCDHCPRVCFRSTFIHCLCCCVCYCVAWRVLLCCCVCYCVAWRLLLCCVTCVIVLRDVWPRSELFTLFNPHYTYSVVFPVSFNIRRCSGFSVAQWLTFSAVRFSVAQWLLAFGAVRFSVAQWLLAFSVVRFRCVVKKRRLGFTVCLGFVHCLVFENNTTFRKLDLIPPQVKGQEGI